MTGEPREVIGVSGEIMKLGPDETLIVRVPSDAPGILQTVEQLHAALPGRVLVFAGDVELVTVPTAAAAVARAWVDAGRNPTAHRIAQRQLRAGWPTLAHALDRLAPPVAGGG